MMTNKKINQHFDPDVVAADVKFRSVTMSIDRGTDLNFVEVMIPTKILIGKMPTFIFIN